VAAGRGRCRLIDFNANDLRSGLDIVFSGDIRNQGDRPFNLDSDTGQLRVGLQFDAPLTRLAERNVYRQSLIEYQQARRRYYTFVDNVNQSLRNTLRTMRLNDLNFELRRAAVYVAIRQVELARLELQRPPRPGEVSELNNTAGRDLIDAFRDLLNAQNDFLSVWVNYEVQRVNLDLDLGTMELDRRGIWIDPGAEIGYTCPTCPPYPGCLGKCRRGCARCNPGGEVEHLPEPLPAGDDVEAFPDDVELLPVPPPAREAPDPVELPEVPVGPRIPDPIVEDETVEAAGG